jgi:hypothetical protein
MTKYLLFLSTLFIQFSANAQTNNQNDKNDTVKVKRHISRTEQINDSLYNIRIKQVYIEDVYIPKDLPDCFKQLDSLMDEDVREKFMAFSDEEVAKRTHGSLGLWLIKKWNLQEGSRLSAYFTKSSVPNADYMAAIIITAYHRHLHKKELNTKELVEFYREKWQQKQEKRKKELEEQGK